MLFRNISPQQTDRDKRFLLHPERDSLGKETEGIDIRELESERKLAYRREQSMESPMYRGREYPITNRVFESQSPAVGLVNNSSGSRHEKKDSGPIALSNSFLQDQPHPVTNFQQGLNPILEVSENKYDKSNQGTHVPGVHDLEITRHQGHEESNKGTNAKPEQHGAEAGSTTVIKQALFEHEIKGEETAKRLEEFEKRVYDLAAENESLKQSQTLNKVYGEINMELVTKVKTLTEAAHAKR